MLLSNAGMPYLVPVIAKLAPLQQSQAVCVILEGTVDTLRIGRSSLEFITWLRVQSRAGERVQWVSSLYRRQVLRRQMGVSSCGE